VGKRKTLQLLTQAGLLISNETNSSVYIVVRGSQCSDIVPSMNLVRFTVYSGWIFVPKWILSANFVNFGVLISKKLGTIFFFHVISKKIEIQNGGHFFQNGGHFLLCFVL
jgi:hypothetical protein